jgi:hypothetical protein
MKNIYRKKRTYLIAGADLGKRVGIRLPEVRCSISMVG